MVGFETGDDAAVYKLNEQQALIFTVDFFPPVVDDPFSFGAVAAANSFSDVYAMGGTPICALNIVGFPVDLPKEILSEIMRGGYTKAQEAGCLIAGGHTVDDKEPKYGLAVVGLVEPDQQVTNAGAKAGDVLVLTKPLGTGIITTAGKQGSSRTPSAGRGGKSDVHSQRRSVQGHDEGGGQFCHGRHRLRAGGTPARDDGRKWNYGKG